MSAAHRSSSNALRAAILLAAALSASGCTTMQDNFTFTSAPRPARQQQAAATDAPAVDASIKTAALPGLANDGQSSNWCRYVKADAGAEATILRSPTLSGSATDSGDASVSLGVNLVDFAKASVVEETAATRCSQKAAEQRLTGAMMIANQADTIYGAKAKADFLRGRMGAVDAQVAKAKALLGAGEITIAEATQIEVKAAQLRKSWSQAEADSQRAAAMPGDVNFGGNAASQLRAAEQKLQESNARMRTLNALKVDVEGGWQHKDTATINPGANPSSFFGKVSVGVRLGAVNPMRQAYEQEAMEARQAALGETYTGIVWQTKEAGKTLERSAANLRSARDSVSSALAKTRETLALLNASGRPEVAGQRIAASLDALALEAELSAINASMAASQKNARLLKASSGN